MTNQFFPMFVTGLCDLSIQGKKMTIREILCNGSSLATAPYNWKVGDGLEFRIEVLRSVPPGMSDIVFSLVTASWGVLKIEFSSTITACLS